MAKPLGCYCEEMITGSTCGVCMQLPPKPKKRLYLAGPMSGMKNHNARAFVAFKSLWTAMGWDVTTPIELNDMVWQKHHNEPFDPYTVNIQYGHPLMPEMFAEDVKFICECDAIALLPGWEDSQGVSRELAVATLFKKEIFDALTCKPLPLLFCPVFMLDGVLDSMLKADPKNN